MVKSFENWCTWFAAVVGAIFSGKIAMATMWHVIIVAFQQIAGEKWSVIANVMQYASSIPNIDNSYMYAYNYSPATQNCIAAYHVLDSYIGFDNLFYAIQTYFGGLLALYTFKMVLNFSKWLTSSIPIVPIE